MTKPKAIKASRPGATPGLPLVPLWASAAAVVLLVHGAAAWAIRIWEPNSQQAGMNGAEPIIFDLAPVPTAPAPLPEEVAALQPEEAQPEVPPPEPERRDVVVSEPKPPPLQKPLPRKVEKPRPKPIPNAAVSQQAGAPSVGAPSASALAIWHGQIYNRIARAADALTVRSGGMAKVIFSVSPTGQVLSVRLSQSSGDTAQDADATAMIRRIGSLPAPPPGTISAMTLQVPIRFKR